MRGPPLFYFDFVVFPILGASLLLVYCRSWQFAELVSLGALIFTLIEYWVHRVALHRFFYHGSHERHHDHPAEYVVFPTWYTPAIFTGFFLVLPLPVFTGLVLGFCWFIYWHHVLHHFDLTTWPRGVQQYALWHLAHHRRDDCNYGITVPIWDFVFGTYQPTKRS